SSTSGCMRTRPSSYTRLRRCVEMGVKAAFVHALHRFYARGIHADAQDAATQPANGTLNDLDASHYCLVVTYRRDGTPVPTPVWFGIDDGRVFFRAEGDSGKVKRIRANATVRAAPCDGRGRPSG